MNDGSLPWGRARALVIRPLWREVRAVIMDLRAELEALAASLGFARFGVARAEALEPEGEQLRRYVREGRHASMGWLAETAEVRADPRDEGMLPSARSVLVFATPYSRGGGALDLAPGRVARYALGRDYHNVLTKRLRRVEAFLRERGHEARHSVDSRPVLERAWAERAGVGFVGKNCCLIVPGLGSHVFLSTVITSAALEPDAPMERRCGSCTLCLDACPTEAFLEARSIDARRCISYLTIEHRGEAPEAHREATGDWLFGCDVCQDVCPYNHSPRAADDPESPYAPYARWASLRADDFLTMSEDAFRALTEGSPLKRARREGLARNAAVVLGNTRDRRHLPVLREAARAHDHASVREAAAWAVAALERGERQ
jgi:epoxyqueuosine reductase